MYLAIVFIVLFRISFGLIRNSELDQLFLDLNDRNTKFYHVKNTGESDEIAQKEPIFISFLKTDVRSGNLKTSPAFSSSVLQDPLNGITEKASKVISKNILEDTLETVAEVSDVLNNKIQEDSLEIIDEKVGKSLSGGILEEPLTRKTRAAIQSKSTEIPEITVVANAELDEGNRCSCKSVTSLSKVPAVFIFVNTVIKTIQSSELLTILFDITDATPEQFGQYKCRFIADFFRRRGFINANIIAAFAVRPIAKYFDVLLPETMMQVYANYIAKFLFAEGILTADNAEKLAMMLYSKWEESAKIYKINYESGYTTKFQAITDGETGFLLSFGEFSYSESWEISFYFAHEWLLAAVDYGTLRDLTE
ncbi:uncharacterized protein LOC129976587 [Argiope bruennichi]|uniref:Uncharacterized protein n=1 Tax=Argiope bruennichi TaxID=94029 RepID=A0A8T0ENL9_ARGBR|nr:uncharacterized protein LOC129976587 [Argiope bruennichi]KAF8777390.1 hypothetical protein HNY73_014258 [Argiope bruennichi]